MSETYGIIIVMVVIYAFGYSTGYLNGRTPKDDDPDED